jgi:hypothetical protein
MPSEGPGPRLPSDGMGLFATRLPEHSVPGLEIAPIRQFRDAATGSLLTQRNQPACGKLLAKMKQMEAPIVVSSRAGKISKLP